MDYQTTPNRKNPFIAPCVLMGVLSLLSSCTIIFSMIFGSLGIIFGILAYRKGQKMENDLILGIITSVIGLVLALIIFVIALVFSFQMMGDPQYRDYLNQVSEEIYGESFDEMLEEMYYE
ncbi:MAG: DUF4190 domain-containing protein [Lachnospiraceae bacterium]|nr:DUF4190 domain-containing protein [Lachnospiraceae bacterium]